VRHKKYNYRGVIAERDSEPIYNVSRWAGLRKIPHANELPFYKLLPDQQDCIEIFGGVRPERYVCEENLEPCPPDDMYLDVDVDADWIKLPDGSYRPSPLDRFIYGYDSDECDNSDVRNEYNTFEKCMTALDSAINQWHCDCVRNVLLQPQTLSDDDVDTATDAVPPSVARKYAISIHDMIKLLKVADRLNATPIRESIKLFGKAHPNIQLRTQLQYSIELMGADNFEKARTILRSIVTDGDPLYIDAWNHLANSETFLSLKNDAMASANMALQLNSDDFHAFTQLGILHFQKGEYSKAEIYFRKRLDFDPWSIVSLKLSELIDLMKD
jgi:hemimethylated DNA binding protein